MINLEKSKDSKIQTADCQKPFTLILLSTVLNSCTCKIGKRKFADLHAISGSAAVQKFNR